MTTKKPLILNNNYITEISSIDNIGIINGIDFATNNIPVEQPARLQWDDGNQTLQLGLNANVNLQLGQEIIALCYNEELTTLNDGEVVYITGAQGNRVSVKRAKADSETTSSGTLGMVTEPITSLNTGFITILGTVNHLNTSSFTDGDLLYLSASVAGGITNIKPDVPNHSVRIGYVQRTHTTTGSIFVKVDNGYEIDELHNVKITTPTNNQILQYNSTLAYWENVSHNFETQANKDVANGYVGLTALKINFKNVLNTFTSYFTNSNTASRTYTFQNKDQTIAGLDDILPTTLAGLSASVGTLSNTDTILQAFNKIAGLIDNESWVSFTPAFTGFTLGNGTATGRYKRLGKTIIVSCKVTIGSTSVFGTSFNFEYTNLPNVRDNRAELSKVTIRDVSTGNNYPCDKIFKQIVCYNAASTYLGYSSLSSTIPFTWATGDEIYINLLYEEI